MRPGERRIVISDLVVVAVSVVRSSKHDSYTMTFNCAKRHGGHEQLVSN